jgi:transposase-like protein
MSDGSTRPGTWKAYLETRLSRPGWSVARLAREAGLHRSTIFRWKSGAKTGLNVASVRAVALAFGEDPAEALRAAGQADSQADDEPVDEEIELVRTDPLLDEDMKNRIVNLIIERRERDREASLAETQRMIELMRHRRAG